MNNVLMNNSSVQINASPKDGSVTTTKIVKMARTNMIVVSTLSLEYLFLPLDDMKRGSVREILV